MDNTTIGIILIVADIVIIIGTILFPKFSERRKVRKLMESFIYGNLTIEECVKGIQKIGSIEDKDSLIEELEGLREMAYKYGIREDR
jgi:hypothetical protein